MLSSITFRQPVISPTDDLTHNNRPHLQPLTPSTRCRRQPLPSPTNGIINNHCSHQPLLSQTNNLSPTVFPSPTSVLTRPLERPTGALTQPMITASTVALANRCFRRPFLPPTNDIRQLLLPLTTRSFIQPRSHQPRCPHALQNKSMTPHSSQSSHAAWRRYPSRKRPLSRLLQCPGRSRGT